jgi:hypothetical protein
MHLCIINQEIIVVKTFKDSFCVYLFGLVVGLIKANGFFYLKKPMKY